MGNDVSRPALPPSPSPTPIKEFQADLLTPDLTLPRTHLPLTPPPSGRSKPCSSTEEATGGSWRPAPSRPAESTTPPQSPTLLGTPTSRLSLSSGSLKPTIQPTTSCSKCHHLIISNRSRRGPKPQSQPCLLKCTHTLCNRCLRTCLLISISTDPFTPAACPACTINNPVAIATSFPAAPSHDTDTDPDNTTRGKLMTIPLAVLGEVATAPEFLAYRLKLREMRTPPSERLYCHDSEGCGMFLSPLLSRGGKGIVDRKGGWGRKVMGVRCPLCAARTCTGCGGRAHAFGIWGKGNGSSVAVTGRLKDNRRRKRRWKSVRKRCKKSAAAERMRLCPRQIGRT